MPIIVETMLSLFWPRFEPLTLQSGDQTLKARDEKAKLYIYILILICHRVENFKENFISLNPQASF